MSNPNPMPPVPPHVVAAMRANALIHRAANQAAQGIEARRQEVARIQEVAGGVWTHTFQIPQDQPGEALKVVSFGVTFAETPQVAHSYETPPNQKLTPGSFPIVNGGVFDWKFSRQSSWGGKLYTGCTFTMVVVAPAGWRCIHHFTLTGRAEANVP